MHPHISEILFSEQVIAQRIRELGNEINRHFAQIDELTVISIINGAIPFTADLIRQIDLPVRIDCIRVSSYQNATSPVQAPNIINALRLDLRDRHVLILDDILDTGHTLKKVYQSIADLHPASLQFGVLLEKKARRAVEVQPDFVGFQIPDAFVVGYGLDFAERYRNLPFIGLLKPEFQQ